MSKISTRAAYGEALAEIGSNPNIVVLDADLQCCTRTDKFAALYPQRARNVGIAEANMVGMAAGLATCGKTVFVNSFAMFTAGRAFEQIRNSLAYPHLNVKVIGTHAGVTVGKDGATHQCNEDLALMRTIPGMTVIAPCDDVEAKAAVRAAYELDGPVYMRFGRLAVPVVNDAEDFEFEIGKGIVMREGTDVTIVACGLMVQSALEAAERLATDGISAEVIDMHTIKPIDADLIVESAKKTGRVVTCEEHSVIGGLGSAVCDVLAERLPFPVRKLGVNAVFGESGPAVDLLHRYGLDADGVEAFVREFMA